MFVDSEPAAAPHPGDDRRTAAEAARHEIEEEHRLLRDAVYKLRHTRDLRALVPQLEDLHALLLRHFAREEAADGLHAAVERTAPHKVNRVEELFREHRELLAEVAALRAAAREYLEGPLATVLAGIREVAGKLHQHEVAETDLFAEAVNEDLGTAG